MSAGVAADVLCAVSCLVWPRTTDVPGLAEPLGFSRTTPLECLSGSVARPSWLVGWRGFGQLLLGDFAGNRRAPQDNASWNHKCVVVTMFETKRLDLAVWCLPDFSHLCLNSEIPDVLVFLSPCRLPTALLPTTGSVVADLLLIDLVLWILQFTDRGGLTPCDRLI